MCGAGVLGAGFGGLETEMIVSMAKLRFPAWVYDVHLGGELVGRAEVGFTDEGEPRVAIIFNEGGRVV